LGGGWKKLSSTRAIDKEMRGRSFPREKNAHGIRTIRVFERVGGGQTVQSRKSQNLSRTKKNLAFLRPKLKPGLSGYKGNFGLQVVDREGATLIQHHRQKNQPSFCGDAYHDSIGQSKTREATSWGKGRGFPSQGPGFRRLRAGMEGGQTGGAAGAIFGATPPAPRGRSGRMQDSVTGGWKNWPAAGGGTSAIADSALSTAAGGAGPSARQHQTQNTARNPKDVPDESTGGPAPLRRPPRQAEQDIRSRHSWGTRAKTGPRGLRRPSGRISAGENLPPILFIRHGPPAGNGIIHPTSQGII